MNCRKGLFTTYPLHEAVKQCPGVRIGHANCDLEPILDDFPAILMISKPFSSSFRGLRGFPATLKAFRPRDLLRRDAKMLQMLLKFGASDTKDFWGRTAYDYACVEPSGELLRVFERMGCCPSSKGRTFFRWRLQ